MLKCLFLILVYSLPKIIKEKRERQPNWTDREKQLLLSLTQMHRSILENKGNDTMTIKRKSEVWDEIVLHMKAAGYNRSKDRLKQQLGRIRSAQRAKEALGKNLNSMFPADDKSPQELRMPLICDEGEIHIKSERDVTDEEAEDGNVRCEEDTLQTLPIKKTNTDVNIVPPTSAIENIAEVDLMGATSSNKTPTHDLSMDNSFTENDKSTPSTHSASQAKQRKFHKIGLNGLQAPTTRERRLRQLHLYRIAVERQRLRRLKEQRKRDRILYRKDIQIQNLKLNILRNLSNQNKDGSSINF